MSQTTCTCHRPHVTDHMSQTSHPPVSGAPHVTDLHRGCCCCSCCCCCHKVSVEVPDAAKPMEDWAWGQGDDWRRLQRALQPARTWGPESGLWRPQSCAASLQAPHAKTRIGFGTAFPQKPARCVEQHVHGYLLYMFLLCTESCKPHYCA